MEFYKKAIWLDSLNEGATHDLGRAYDNLGIYDTAFYYYSKAIEIDTEYALAYRSRGFALYKQRKYNDAIEDYYKSLSIDSLNPTAYNNLGAIYEEIEQYSIAIEMLHRGLSLKPDHYGVASKLALFEFYRGNYDAALSLSYKTIGNLGENAAAPHLVIGHAYLDLEQYDSAIHHLDIAISYDPVGSFHYSHRGQAYAAENQHQKAIIEFTKAIEDTPNHAPYHLHRGDSFFAIGKFQDALSDYNEAVRCIEIYEGYSDGPVYYRYNPSVCYHKRGQLFLALGDTLGYRNDSLFATIYMYPEIGNEFLIKELHPTLIPFSKN